MSCHLGLDPPGDRSVSIAHDGIPAFRDSRRPACGLPAGRLRPDLLGCPAAARIDSGRRPRRESDPTGRQGREQSTGRTRHQVSAGVVCYGWRKGATCVNAMAGCDGADDQARFAPRPRLARIGRREFGADTPVLRLTLNGASRSQGVPSSGCGRFLRGRARSSAVVVSGNGASWKALTTGLPSWRFRQTMQTDRNGFGSAK